MTLYPQRSEVWWKVWCPNCSKPNWFCDGDPNDLTRPDKVAGQCFDCDSMWWFDEICEEIADLDEQNIEDVVEKGRETPT